MSTLHLQCLQDEDCSAYSVVPDETQLTGSMARGIDAQVAAAVDVCNSSSDADVAQAVICRLEFLQHLLTVRCGRSLRYVPKGWPAHTGRMPLRLQACFGPICSHSVPACRPAGATTLECGLRLTENALQVLRQLKHASSRSVDRARQATDAALRALDRFPDTAAAIPDADPPGVVPDLHRDAGTLPPPELPHISRDDATAYLRQFVTELRVLTHAQHVASIRFTLLLTQHVSRTCGVPLVRGLMFLLLSPLNVQDEDELPPWAPCSRHYLDAMALPYSQLSRVRAVPGAAATCKASSAARLWVHAFADADARVGLNCSGWHRVGTRHSRNGTRRRAGAAAGRVCGAVAHRGEQLPAGAVPE